MPRRGPAEDETHAAASGRELRSKTNADRNAKRIREEETNLLVEEDEEDEDIFDLGGGQAMLPMTPSGRPHGHPTTTGKL